MIPKIIHYIWVGNKAPSRLVKKCIKSWKKFCPDFQIMLWNENNLNLDVCNFVKEAYQKKKYAFVADYFRYDILYKNGGVYLDTDMELLKPINSLLCNKAFVGFEDNIYASCSIIGAEKNNKHIKMLLEELQKEHFVMKNSKLNLITLPIRLTNYLSTIGIKKNGQTQIVDKFKIYSRDYFYPISFDGGKYFSNNTFTIHHWSGSWLSKEDKRAMKKLRFINSHKTVRLVIKIWNKTIGKIKK